MVPGVARQRGRRSYHPQGIPTNHGEDQRNGDYSSTLRPNVKSRPIITIATFNNIKCGELLTNPDAPFKSYGPKRED